MHPDSSVAAAPVDAVTATLDSPCCAWSARIITRRSVDFPVPAFPVQNMESPSSAFSSVSRCSEESGGSSGISGMSTFFLDVFLPALLNDEDQDKGEEREDGDDELALPPTILEAVLNVLVSFSCLDFALPEFSFLGATRRLSLVSAFVTSSVKSRMAIIDDALPEVCLPTGWINTSSMCLLGVRRAFAIASSRGVLQHLHLSRSQR